MSFILKIFFSGLIALVPNHDGSEITVVLLNAGHAHHASDGTALPLHKPMLVARAAGCKGVCPRGDTSVAEFLFTGSTAQAVDSLARAIDRGAVWQLAESDISLAQLPSSGVSLMRKPLDPASSMPRTAAEREDLRWVADLNQIHPKAGGVDPTILSQRPPKGLLAARLRLKSGTMFTHSMIQVDGRVQPLHFEPLGGNGGNIQYVQAAASWVAVEIRVPGDSLEIVDRKFGGKTRRSMKLTPRDGVIELAILNITNPSVAREMIPRATPKPGRHFELYWELAKKPPARKARPVPQIGTSSRTRGIDWRVLHPADERRSSILLDRLLLGDGRGPYDIILCPMAQFGFP